MEAENEQLFIEACNRGLACATKGHWDQAITLYTIAIEFNPKYAESYYCRGKAFAAKGEFDKAITDYTKALSLNSKDADVYYWRGKGYFYSRQYDEAWADVETCQRLGSVVPPGFLADLRKTSG